MDKDELIANIIERHERRNLNPIVLSNGVSLLPQLDYSGKMARDAYRRNRYFMNKHKTHAGLLDFKIIDSGTRMEHELLILKALSLLDKQIVRTIHAGNDPDEMGLDEVEKLDMASTIQAAFVEQEVNWGEEVFQSRTFYGRKEGVKDERLSSSAPRDYLMTYLDKAFHLKEDEGWSTERIDQEVIRPMLARTEETRTSSLMPTFDLRTKVIMDQFSAHTPSVYNGAPTSKWIAPHLERIKTICQTRGENPIYVALYHKTDSRS